MAKTTPRQKVRLEQFGANVPPTKTAATALLKYLLEGTGVGKIPKGMDAEAVQKRAAILRATQEKWVGKQVTTRHVPGQVRVVVRILAKTPDDIEGQMEMFEMEKGAINPFKAVLAPRPGKRENITVSVGSLMLHEEDAPS